MSAAVAYGSITIVDITDIAEFSVQPMSNLPIAVIYDPDHSTFTPNWATSNLQLTPSIYYGGTALTPNGTGVTVTWQRQVGTSSPTALTTGETVTNGVLNVTANQFTANSTMLTYIVTATYVEPISQQTLTSQGQITFTLVKNASTAKECTITGESIFKYDTSQTLIGSSSITLTGRVNNVSISGWKYQDSNGDWVTYPNSGTGTTLSVSASDNVFINDKCIIKLQTNDANVYDLHTITKLRDGAAGNATVSAVLTNDDQMIPFTKNAQQQEVGDFSAATSQIIIYEGGVNVTETWSISSAGSGVNITRSRSDGTHGSNNDTVAVTSFTGSSVQSGNVVFTCTKSGYNTLIKTFSVVKVSSGADGVSPTIYSVEADTLAINKSISGNLSPSSVTFSAYSQNGSNKQPYSGRFKIFENLTLADYEAASPKPQANYTSSGDESTYTYNDISSSASTILCILFAAGNTTTKYDSQMVVITSDGAKGDTGDTGADGKSAVNIILGNYADVLNCTNNNYISGNQTITVPFSAYEGTTKIPCTVSTTGISLHGVTPTVTNATASADGSIVWALTPSANQVTNPSGSITLTFTATASSGSVTVTETYSWSRSTAAENTVLLQLFTPTNGNVLNENITQTTITTLLTDGSTDATSSVSGWKWYKFANNGYQEISGATSSFYVVQGSTVDSYASFKCEATYNNRQYVAYISVFDKTDPIQVSVLSSVGNQLVNGVGCGALYVKVTRNNAEIDAMKSERFLTTNPSSATSGDFYYKLNKTNKTLQLMKYTNSWAADNTDYYTGTYRWHWRDKDGNVITEYGSNHNSLPTGGKVIYIDGDMIDGKIVADVEVTI